MKCRSCLPLVRSNIKQLAILAAYFLLVLGDDWATASKVLSANDASTGTITDMPPGFEKRPASCDEMLAQAVVLANEERANANKDREEAIKASQRALQIAEFANDQLREANEKVSLLSAQISENCRDVTARMEGMERAARNDMEVLTERTNSQILEIQAKADLAVKEALEERDEAIASAREEAAQNISVCEKLHSEDVAILTEKTREEVEKATLHARKVEDDAASRLAIMNETMRVAVDEIEQKANNSIREVEEMVKTEVAYAQKESKEALAKAESLIKEARARAEEKSIQATKEASEQIAAANALVEKSNVEAEQRIRTNKKEADAKIQAILVNATAEIQMVEKDAAKNIEKTDALMKQTKQNALEEMNAMKAATAAEVARINNEAALQIKQSQDEAKKKVELMKKDASVAQETVGKLRQQIQTLEKERATLQEKFRGVSKDLAYWENLEQKYCNFTLMRADSKLALEKSIAFATQEAKSAWKVIQFHAIRSYGIILKATQEKTIKLVDKSSHLIAALNDAADPYIIKIITWYQQNMKETIDTYATPFYRSRALPFFVSCRYLVIRGWTEARGQFTPFYQTRAMPFLVFCHDLVIRGWSEAKRQSHHGFILLLELIRKFISFLINEIEDSERAKIWIPSIILSSLQYAENNTEKFIVSILKIQSVFLVFLFRARLCKIILAILLLPFRIIWFLCPLRFLFRSKKSQRIDDAVVKKCEIKAELLEPSVASTSKKMNTGKKNGFTANAP